jgi:Na+-transporting NADH:ubiquinone oxidoreductase subunit NqrD
MDNNFVNNSINSDIDTLMPHFTDIEVIVISVVAGIMSLVIITGNLLIMIAYGINKKLSFFIY